MFIGTHYKQPRRLYTIWIEMRRRCLDKTRPEYKNYGGRGITVCDEWLKDFVSFRDWALENGYDKKLTLDRVKNDLGYLPKNCKWSTYTEQNRNRRDTILTVEKVKQIRAMYIPEKFGYVKVGRLFGITNFHVRSIIKGYIWN